MSSRVLKHKPSRVPSWHTPKKTSCKEGTEAYDIQQLEAHTVEGVVVVVIAL